VGADLSRSSGHALTNPAVADKLLALAHVLATRGENPFKVKAYRRAARVIRAMGDSVAEQVAGGQDLTRYAGIGPAIAAVIQEIVQTGTTHRTKNLETENRPELVAAAAYPRLDPRRVLRIFRKLNISTVEELKQSLDTGQIHDVLGATLDQHVRRAMSDSEEVLLYEADSAVNEMKGFLVERCGVQKAEAAGEYRRRVDVVHELSFVIETTSFPAVLECLRHYGGRAQLLEDNEKHATFRLSSGLLLRVTAASRNLWGAALIQATGSDRHLRALKEAGFEALLHDGEVNPTEEIAYGRLGLSHIPAELREGRDEVALAQSGRLPNLVTVKDIRGELHAHTTSSDGADTLEAMAEAARARGLEYIGISDHSQSLKIARGLSEPRLKNQLRFIDKLNGRLNGIRILKSAEVDILPDGTLDYSNDLLKELDYTVCSIHSKFGLSKTEQTERIMRAMDNPYFTFLGHATGRLLLKRSGYEIDMERLIEHARKNKCFFEMNSSPDRLDLSADNARLAGDAGIGITINTDAHSTGELSFISYGVDQARRAGLDKRAVLNTRSWNDLRKAIQR
jgi:DNA polymerase (family 10)